MTALIRCVLHIDPRELTEDEYFLAWGQVKYYLETVQIVKFT